MRALGNHRPKGMQRARQDDYSDDDDDDYDVSATAGATLLRLA